MHSVQEAVRVSGSTGSRFFAGVPEQWKWMFDSVSLQKAFLAAEVRANYFTVHPICSCSSECCYGKIFAVLRASDLLPLVPLHWACETIVLQERPKSEKRYHEISLARL